MTKCRGCGILLQNKDINNIGYVDDLNKNVCMRCFRLANYGEYRQVDLNNDDYLKIINSISKESLIVYTTDIMSMNLEALDSFERVLLVITKRDILPRNVNDNKIIDYVKKIKSNVIAVVMVSSLRNYNMDCLYNMMIKYSNNRDVYLVGNTNTGKSTLINRLIKNYGSDSNMVTVSMYPSTTLDKVSIKLNDLTVIDTPGLIDRNSIVNYLDNKGLKRITSKGEIKPKSCQISGKGSMIIDDYVRIDYDTDKSNSMVFFVPNGLDVRFNSRKNNKLVDYNLFSYNLTDGKDIVIPGLGFIKVVGAIKINLYVLNGVKPYIRDNMI